PVYPPTSTWKVPAGPVYPETEFRLNETPVALGEPVPTLLMRSARPAPFCNTLREMVNPLTPSNRRMPAVAPSQPFWKVLLVIDELVRLNAYRPRPLPSKTLLEIVIAVAGLVASVEEKPMACPELPTKLLLSINTLERVPPALYWSV